MWYTIAIIAAILSSAIRTVTKRTVLREEKGIQI